MTDAALHADAEHEEKAEVAAEEAVEAAPAVHPFGTSGGEHSRAYRCRRWSGATYSRGARPQNFQKIKCGKVEPDGRNRR